MINHHQLVNHQLVYQVIAAVMVNVCQYRIYSYLLVLTVHKDDQLFVMNRYWPSINRRYQPSLTVAILECQTTTIHFKHH